MLTRKEKLDSMREILKVSLPIRTVLTTTFNAKKEGEFYFCPLHPNTSRATLRITPNGSGYNCFHCNSHGNVISLLHQTARENIEGAPQLVEDYGEFTLKIFQTYGIPIPYDNLETEYDNSLSTLEQVDSLLTKQKRAKVEMSEETVTLECKKMVRKYKVKTISDDELIQFFYKLQSGDTTVNELLSSFSSIESFQDMIEFGGDFLL